MSQIQKAILIIGGSRGIGRATALMAAAQGWHVVISYRSDREAAESTVQQITGQGVGAACIQGDVCSEAGVQQIFDGAWGECGRLDAVVINAGIVAPPLPLAEMTVDRIRNMMETNVIGAMLCARQAARVLPRPKGVSSASIVFVSSAAARIGSPHEYVDYAASKGAIDTLTLGLSKELAAQNIRVNAVRPGIIATDIHASGGQPDRAERLGPNIPLGRAGMADEVAGAIMWLCSESASYTTGALLDVAGGR